MNKSSIIFTEEDLKNIGLKKEENNYIINKCTIDDAEKHIENYIKITLKGK